MNLGRPVDVRTRALLRRLLAEVGQVAACRQLNVSARTFERAMAGLGLTRGSHALIRAGLAAVTAAEPPPRPRAA